VFFIGLILSVMNSYIGIMQNQLDFYQKLRIKIRNWADSNQGRSYQWSKWLLAAPDLFHLLIRLAVDPDVPIQEKTKLAAVIAYFISPLDLLPELFLGPSGFIDDVVLSAYTLNAIVNRTDKTVLVRHWAGEEDVLEVIQKILSAADQILGSGLFRRLKGIFK
jgi:uncharacterized membrane protein YkvA (DUF1232 family)